MRTIKIFPFLIGVIFAIPSFGQNLELKMAGFNGRGDGCKYLNNNGKVSYDVVKLSAPDEYSFEVMKADELRVDQPMFGLNYKEQRESKTSDSAVASCGFRFDIYSRIRDQKIRMSVPFYSAMYGWEDDEGIFANNLSLRIMAVGSPESSRIINREVYARGEHKPIVFNFATGRDGFHTRCSEKITLELGLTAMLSTDAQNDLEKAQSLVEMDSLAPLRAIVLPCE